VNDPAQLPQTLLARGRAEARTTPEFHVDFPVAGRFVTRVHSVSPDARLAVSVDGSLAAEYDLPAQGVAGRTSTFDEQWGVWRCQYDQDYAIDVPAGRHVIRLANSHENGSWIRLSGYRLTNYAPPGIRAVALSGETVTLVWLQNLESTWANERDERPPRPISGATLTIATTTKP